MHSSRQPQQIALLGKTCRRLSVYGTPSGGVAPPREWFLLSAAAATRHVDRVVTIFPRVARQHGWTRHLTEGGKTVGRMEAIYQDA